MEITESALLSDLDTAIDIAHDLKSRGMRLALDDFGTGYSSLRYLKSLPLDELKIDQSFIGSMNEKRESRKIAAAVAGLGQSLGLTTVAEGIEDKSHANMVYYLGCDLGQGYLYSRPIPAKEALPMIAKDVLSAPAASPLLAAEMAANLEVAPALRLAQLQAIYEGAPDGLCFLDRKLRYVSVNKRFNEMFPSRDEARLGKSVEEMSPATFHKIELYLRRALYGEPSQNVEVAATRPGSSPSRAALVSFQPVRDEADEIVGVSITVRDISSFKKLEHDLREYRDHYRMPLDLSRNTYPFIVNPQGELVWEGERGPRGYEIDELSGHKWHKLVHPDDLTSVLDSWKSDLAAGVAHDHTYRMRVPDGTYHWVRSRATPRHDEHGQILGWYGLLEDIDDHDPHEP
jgi:PAS domain S-box-containing protein